MNVDLTGVPYVDGHMHPPLERRPATPDEYAWPWYEGNRDYVHMARELVPYRWGLRQLGDWLGCEAEEAAVIAAIGTRSAEEWVRECVTRGNVAGLVIDTGHPPPDLVRGVDWLRDASGIGCAWLVRIEREAERLLTEADSLDDWLVRIETACEQGLDDGACGLKTIVAYRTGLGIAEVDRHAAEHAFAAVSDAARAGEPVRLASKPLNDLLVLRALDLCRLREVPLQLHAGYGDRDIDLRLGSPFAFRWALESGAADGVQVVFLHASWPHIRDAAVMAAIYQHLYVDIAAAIPPIGHAALVESWREALTIAPLTRIHASSDAAGIFEHVTIGAIRARDTLGIALGELVGTGELSLGEAERAGELILAGNSRRLYGLD
jgi:predicted TIM-barrel fold metal-dependent hydrolase